ncbi:MAG: phosphoglucosamine mutase [Alphaproteobacteria bacterium]
MKLFGTDGIRGTAGTFPMTTSIVAKVAKAAGHILRPKGLKNPIVIIGKDTRLSGYTFEPALVSGFASVGWNVQLLGPLPTPAIAALTTSMRAQMGVMISASHNPYIDNGIKIFDPNGFKISTEQELRIEELVEILEQGTEDSLIVPPTDLGRVSRLDGSDGAGGRYIELAKSSFPNDLDLFGMKIVLDCAHGASYRVAPRVLHELGAEVIEMGVDPDGTNINDQVGATAPEALKERVIKEKADIGIALDGDADRLMIVNDSGEVVDGDQILATLATFLSETGRLGGRVVVATVMSNMGLDTYLSDLGLSLVRTAVGDKHVTKKMRELGANLGGEQSGHMILSDYSTTGDGLVAGLQVLGLMRRKKKTSSEATRCFKPLPQMIRNVRFHGENPLNDLGIQKFINDVELALGEKGRVLVRKSGTEPLLRLMVEAEEEELVIKTLNNLESAVTI